MKTRWAIWAIIFILAFTVVSRQEWKKSIYYGDTLGYYLYLPALVIYHDVGKLEFLHSVNEKYFVLPDSGRWFIHDGWQGRKTDKYAIGTCLFELPLFFVAHIYCLSTGSFSADGFSAPYNLAGILSCLLWTLAGIYVLSNFLSCYFNDLAVAVTILCIGCGTNLFYYSAYDQGLSHPYSFFLFSCLLYCTHLWYTKQMPKQLLVLGLLLGLITITRPINIIVVVIPMFWQITGFSSLRERLKFYTRYKMSVVIALVLFTCVILIQLSYWKYTTGHWLYFSYKDEGFNFSHPKIFKGLFSYRKGWFVYTPLAFQGLIIGSFIMGYAYKKMLPMFLLFFLLFIYAIFSWKNWWYGGGFGCRPLIESLAVLSFPFAALVEFVRARGRILLSLAFSVLLTGCIALNVFQSYQYSEGIIHCDRMSEAYYWQVFGKTKINPDDYEKYLLSEHEYWNEMREISSK